MNQKEYFNNSSSTWDEKFLTPKLSAFLEKLVPQFHLKSGQNILDVGTGTGALIPYLFKAVGSDGTVTAIDYSEKMVKVSKSKYSHIKNINIKIGDIEEDIFPAETFHAVVCFGVFPHLEHKEKVLQNINSMLKTGGKLVIAHALSSEELKTHHKEVSKHVANSVLPEEAQMKRLLEQARFTQITINDEPGCYFCLANKA